MRLFTFLILTLIFISCNTEETPERVIEYEAPQRAELSKDSKIFLGNRLFSEKTCITCHSIDKVKTAPSVVDIVGQYKKNNADIVGFLKGISEPIVETDSSQIAIMQANIDGFLKKITDEELDAISTYMYHVTELKSK